MAKKEFVVGSILAALLAGVLPAVAQGDTSKAQVQTVFQGTTISGLLLNAYAFWQMGQIAMIASIVSFAAGVIMLILAGLGFWHRRHTPAGAELGV